MKVDHSGRLGVLEGQIVEVNRNLLVAFNKNAELALQVTEIETRINTTVSLSKWVFAVVGADLLISVLKLVNVI